MYLTIYEWYIYFILYFILNNIYLGVPSPARLVWMGPWRKESWFVKEDQRVYKTTNKSDSIHTNETLLFSNRLELSSWPLTHVFKKIETTMRWNCMSKALRFLQLTVKYQDCPFFTVFLTIKISSQNISITLLQISLKFHEHRGRYWRKKAPLNDFGRTVPSAEIYCCKYCK